MKSKRVSVDIADCECLIVSQRENMLMFHVEDNSNTDLINEPRMEGAVIVKRDEFQLLRLHVNDQSDPKFAQLQVVTNNCYIHVLSEWTFSNNNAVKANEECLEAETLFTKAILQIFESDVLGNLYA